MGKSPKTGRTLEAEQGNKGPGVLSAIRSWGGWEEDSESE
jgi:hypothetical protein